MFMFMYANRSNQDYVDTRRPDMTLRKHYSTKFRIKKTRNTKVLKRPYYRGVQMWEKLPTEVQMVGKKVEFKTYVKNRTHNK